MDGREWTLPGWFEEVCGWLERTLAEAGVRAVHEIVQLRTWPSSCVLFVRTEAGNFYFKAVAESIRHEGAVTAYLAQHFPGAVARIVATKPERRWFLMTALEGRKLEDIGDAMAWERAAAGYAQLQLACVARRPDLLALGCPTRGLDALAAEIDPLSADGTGLRLGEPDGLSACEVERLRTWAPELRRRCQRLADDGMPLTIEHGDLWPGNFLVDDASCALIDWEDVAIGHPFISLAPLIVGLSMFQPHLASREVTQRLEHAYLAGFAGSRTAGAAARGVPSGRPAQLRRHGRSLSPPATVGRPAASVDARPRAADTPPGPGAARRGRDVGPAVAAHCSSSVSISCVRSAGLKSASYTTRMRPARSKTCTGEPWPIAWDGLAVAVAPGISRRTWPAQ